MAWRYHGRASVDPENPQAFGVSDRSGRWVNFRDLRWQFDWRGPRLMNLRILVPVEELDKPQSQLRPKPVPPDPVPILNARPEPFSQDNTGISAAQSVEAPSFSPPLLDE